MPAPRADVACGAQSTAVPFEVYNAWKPFAAADAAVLERRTAELAALSAELAAERMAECTFRPACPAPDKPPSRAASVLGSPSPTKAAAAAAARNHGGHGEAEE